MSIFFFQDRVVARNSSVELLGGSAEDGILNFEFLYDFHFSRWCHSLWRKKITIFKRSILIFQQLSGICLRPLFLATLESLKMGIDNQPLSMLHYRLPQRKLVVILLTPNVNDDTFQCVIQATNTMAAAVFVAFGQLAFGCGGCAVVMMGDGKGFKRPYPYLGVLITSVTLASIHSAYGLTCKNSSTIISVVFYHFALYLCLLDCQLLSDYMVPCRCNLCCALYWWF